MLAARKYKILICLLYKYTRCENCFFFISPNVVRVRLPKKLFLYICGNRLKSQNDKKKKKTSTNYRYINVQLKFTVYNTLQQQQLACTTEKATFHSSCCHCGIELTFIFCLCVCVFVCKCASELVNHLFYIYIHMYTCIYTLTLTRTYT